MSSKVKISFIIGILITGYLYYSKSDHSKLEIESLEKFNANIQTNNSIKKKPIGIKSLTDKSKLQFKKSLNANVSDSEILEKILDFTLPVQSFNNNSYPVKKLKEHINKAIPEILNCLPTLCGAEPTEEGFISQQGSMAHDSIERYLEVSLDYKNIHNDYLINDELLVELATINDSAIQTLVVEIIGSELAENTSLAKKFFNEFNGESLTKLISNLSKNKQSKSFALDLMKEGLSNKDSYNIIELSKALKDIEYSKDELIELAKHTCHLNEDETKKHNYLMTKMYFNEKAKSMNTLLEWNIICP